MTFDELDETQPEGPDFVKFEPELQRETKQAIIDVIKAEHDDSGNHVLPIVQSSYDLVNTREGELRLNDPEELLVENDSIFPIGVSRTLCFGMMRMTVKGTAVLPSSTLGPYINGTPDPVSVWSDMVSGVFGAPWPFGVTFPLTAVPGAYTMPLPIIGNILLPKGRYNVAARLFYTQNYFWPVGLSGGKVSLYLESNAQGQQFLDRSLAMQSPDLEAAPWPLDYKSTDFPMTEFGVSSTKNVQIRISFSQAQHHGIGLSLYLERLK